MSVAHAEDWPQFLGPQRNGHASAEEKSLPDTFPGEPSVLWTQDIGSGHAGPVVAQGKVICHHRLGDESVVQAFDAITGKELWSTRSETSYRDSFGMDEGPRAVPAVQDGRVFTHGADGVLQSFDLASGKELWKVDTVSTMDSPQGFFGRACSPLVVAEKVILTPGGKAAICAFEASSGKLLWATAGDEASYASPVMASENTILAWLRNNLSTFRSSDGKLLDSAPWRPEIEASVSSATPIMTPLGWFITAEYDVGASLWNVTAEGKCQQTWKDDSLLNAHYATPVYHDGHVYGFDGRQERGMTLRCLALDGKQVRWESPKVTGGTVLLVKDKLIVLTEEGELWVVRASPQKFDVLLTHQMQRSGHRAYAAYSNGVIYARDSQKLTALKIVP
jgi:outer membrane protein assembly factor BamB